MSPPDPAVTQAAELLAGSGTASLEDLECALERLAGAVDGDGDEAQAQAARHTARMHWQLVLRRLERHAEGHDAAERALAFYHGYLAERAWRAWLAGTETTRPSGADPDPATACLEQERDQARSRLAALPALGATGAVSDPLAASAAWPQGAGSPYDPLEGRFAQDLLVAAAQEVRQRGGAVDDVTLGQACLAQGLRAISTFTWDADAENLLQLARGRHPSVQSRPSDADPAGQADPARSVRGVGLGEAAVSCGLIMLTVARTIAGQATPAGAGVPGRPSEPAESDELAELAERAEQLLRRMEDPAARNDPRTLVWSPLLHGAVGLLLSVACIPLDDQTQLADLRRRAEEHLARAPEQLRSAASGVSAVLDVRDVLFDDTGADLGDPEETQRLLAARDLLRTTVGDAFGELGGDVMAVMRLAQRAERTRSLPDVGAALEAARSARAALPAGHALHQGLVSQIAYLAALKASLTHDRGDAIASVQAAADAVTLIDAPDFSLLQPFLAALAAAAPIVPGGGRQPAAEQALGELLGRGDHEPLTAAALEAALGMAVAFRWAGGPDVGAGHRARHLLSRAEGRLRALPDDERTVQLTVLLLQFNLAMVALWGDRDAGPDVARLADRLERSLDADPALEARFGALLPQEELRTAASATADLRLVGMSPISPDDGVRGLIRGARRMVRTLGTVTAITDAAPVRALFPQRLSFADTAGAITDAVRQQVGDQHADPAHPQGLLGAAMAALTGDRDGFRTAFARATATTASPTAPTAEETDARLRQALLGMGRVLDPGRRPLAAEGRPEPAALAAATAALREAIGNAEDAADARLMHEAEDALGVALAELYWAGAGSPEDLQQAVAVLARARDTEDRRLPRVERADLVGVQACCHAELGRLGLAPQGLSQALVLVRAALGELARCVLLQAHAATALRIAQRSEWITGTALAWCLTAGRYAEAIELTENGRGLVLAAATLTGRVPQLLRAQGDPEAADAWCEGDLERGFAALAGTAEGAMVLRAVSVQDIGLALVAAGLDALVYVVPPSRAGLEPPGAPAAERCCGHALIVTRALTHDAVELPAVDGPAPWPVEGYLAAYRDAVAGWGREAAALGFRGSPAGGAWARALDELGAWAHRWLIGPLLDRFGIDVEQPPARRPLRLAVVPVGSLGAVPFAAAWTADRDLPGGRRYAVHDLELSQTASARLLADVSARRPVPLRERPVFLVDPLGDLGYGQLAAEAAVETFYPDARVYGLLGKDGPGRPEDLLAALTGDRGAGPGEGAAGRGEGAAGPGEGAASVLHLITHARLPDDGQADPLAGTLLRVAAEPPPGDVPVGEPVALAPGVAVPPGDGRQWLSLRQVLDRARDARASASCGLVICDACVTDLTAGYPDESLTLATAFLAAGATSAIGTRWPLDDDTAAVLTFALHHQLSRGTPPGAALRAAQLWLIDPGRSTLPGLPRILARELASGRWAHPASWAAYTYHGGWSGPTDGRR